MKVLMIGPARSVKGGISAVVNHYYQAGLEQRIGLEYVATMEEGSKLHKLKTAIVALVKFSFSLKKADLVHIHMASDSSMLRKLPFLLLAKWKRKKVVVHQHGGNVTKFFDQQCPKIAKRWIVKVLDRADLFLVVSPHLQQEFGKLLHPQKIYLFNNTIFLPKQQVEDYGKKNLVFLGRLCQEKGIGELLQAVIAVKEEVPDLQLYLGGVWENLKWKSLADAHSDFIHQLGWIGEAQKQEVLQKCNIFVLPTYFEGLPISLLEAMAYGCACVATSVGGIPQLITDGETGMLIEAKDTEALKQVLMQLLSDETLQQSLGRAARKKIQEEYNLDQQLEELLQWYNQLIGQNSCG